MILNIVGVHETTNLHGYLLVWSHDMTGNDVIGVEETTNLHGYLLVWSHDMTGNDVIGVQETTHHVTSAGLVNRVL